MPISPAIKLWEAVCSACHLGKSFFTVPQDSPQEPPTCCYWPWVWSIWILSILVNTFLIGAGEDAFSNSSREFLHSLWMWERRLMTTAQCKQTGPKPLGGVLAKCLINRTCWFITAEIPSGNTETRLAGRFLRFQESLLKLWGKKRRNAGWPSGRRSHSTGLLTSFTVWAWLFRKYTSKH